MTTGEKIKYFRCQLGMSQEMLGSLSGINPATIKKYEYGIRNPKPAQLLKIANAIGVSINVFMDFDIETVSDVLSLIFKLDEQIDMNFEAEKDENGKYIPSTMKISFESSSINKKLCSYLYVKQMHEDMKNGRQFFDTDEEHQKLVTDFADDIEFIKTRLVLDNQIITKGTDGYAVKLFPQ